MTIPIWILLAALAVIIAAVGIAYRSGFLMGAESVTRPIRVATQKANNHPTHRVQMTFSGQTATAEEFADLLLTSFASFGIKVTGTADVDTVRERRASYSRTPGRVDSSGKAVLERSES